MSEDQPKSGADDLTLVLRQLSRLLIRIEAIEMRLESLEDSRDHDDEVRCNEEENA